ncbi:threonylcarbamoyl-AMP synthase [Candidatus Woesearchaeota archaeon]|nr:threonylcarbamoyl-AMP synthase [Candidatus Woesearchaeota archaeon]
MLVIKKKDFLKDRQKAAELITYSSVFVYPTDTIYGIGCDARSISLVRRIRDAKDSHGQPFSVIAPSKDWIKQNLKYKPEFDEWLDRLPGPYTLIMKIKNRECVSQETTAGKGTVGVRIPKNWFSDIVAEAGIPIITTSVNSHGQKPVTKIADIPESIKKHVDFAVDDGVIDGSPSTIVDLTKSPPEIIRRK